MQCIFHGCQREAADNVSYCPLHGGVSAQRAVARQRQMNYDLMHLRADLEKQVHAPHMHDLKEEIGLLRIMLARVLNNAGKDPLALVAAIPQATPMIATLERLITSSAKLEAFFGEFMTPQQVDALVENILDIITDEVKDPDTLARIADRIGQATTLIETGTLGHELVG